MESSFEADNNVSLEPVEFDVRHLGTAVLQAAKLISLELKEV